MKGKKRMFRKSDLCVICGKAIFKHDYPTQAEHEVAADLLGVPATVSTEQDMTAALAKIESSFRLN